MAVFDNIHYTRHNQTIPSGKTWAQTFQWFNAIFVSATELRVTNADGSVTIITGIGFTQNPDGTPTFTGDVSGIERKDAERITTYESLDFVGGTPLLDDLIGFGLGPWMTEGDDLYTLNRTDLAFGDPATGEGGEDTIETTGASFTLSAQYESLTYTGSSNFVGTGNAGNNILTGSTGNDTLKGLAGNDDLDGGVGNDTMTGGTGNDYYIVDQAGDKVVELAGSAQGKNDGVGTALNVYTLPVNVERLDFQGTGAFTGTGNASDNEIFGGSGNDHLIGLGGNDVLDALEASAGNDTLEGGMGNDTYGVKDAGDVVIEAVNAGIDSIYVSGAVVAAFDLTATVELKNVENLYYLGSSAFTGTGNDLNNNIQGREGLDTLTGGLGNDTLNGGLDNHVETLDGGAGNDTYQIWGFVADDIADSGGIDTVSLNDLLTTYTLDDDIENAFMSSGSAVNITGNALANRLTGGNGNDTLKGGGGLDTFVGGAGDDTYLDVDLGETVIEAAKGGTDWVITAAGGITLGANIENLQFDPTGGGGLATGNSLANVMKGGLSADTLKGGAGNDTMSGSEILDGQKDRFEGGLGDDTYILIESQNDETVVELAAQGNDTIEIDGMGTPAGLSSISLGTIANVENVKVRAYTSLGVFTAEGNTLNNRLTGGDQNDNLDGLEGNDTLDGGTGGTDNLRGGSGNDTFIVRHIGVAIDESAANFNSGIDTVEAYLQSYTLGDDVENLTLKGGTMSRSATGNALANIITGDIKNDTLDGGGDDGKADTLRGGEGADTYIVYAGDVIVEVVKPLNDDPEDEVQTALTAYTLGADLENLNFTGVGSVAFLGTGNTRHNEITGGAGNDVLKGLAGDDVLTGGEGNDTLDGGTGNDDLFAGGGADSLIGGAGNDSLRAEESDGVADILAGGMGNDTYYVGELIDVVSEIAGQGTDLVIWSTSGPAATYTYTLAANVESFDHFGNDTLHVIGNDLNNKITTNMGADTIEAGLGNDTLGGGQFDDVTDTLDGGLGNDTYLEYAVNNLDEIIDAGGIDTILYFSNGISSSYNFAGTTIEKLTIDGNTGDTITIKGNSLANTITGDLSNDSIDGGSGKDTLAGGVGNDTLYGGNDGTTVDMVSGGAGDDTYRIDAGDVVTELANKGTDTVETNTLATYTLSANVENLTYTGGGSFTGIGNTLANVLKDQSETGAANLKGMAGNDTLDGGNDLAIDTLEGGTGNDTYNTYIDDIVIETATGGNDTEVFFGFALATAFLDDNVENLKNGDNADDFTGIGNTLNNVMTGGTNSDELQGGLGNDTLSGGDGNDDLIGGDGNDSLSGGAGNDTLTGGIGNDALEGGLGEDKFVFAANGDGVNVIADFLADAFSLSQGDTIHVTDAADTDVNLLQQADGVLVTFDTGDTSILLKGLKVSDLNIANDFSFG